MTGKLNAAWQALAMRRTQWRRARNMKAGARAASGTVPVARWAVAAAVLLALGGAAIIAGHARNLSHAAEQQLTGSGTSALDALQGAVPGAGFAVPARAGVTLARHGDATILIAAGMRASEPVRVDLCTQLQADSRLLPLRIGYQFSDIARMAARSDAIGKQITFRNVAVAGPELSGMPQIVVTGHADANFAKPLKVAVSSRPNRAQWVSDAGPGRFGREGWVMWDDGALRLQRRASAGCKTAGELVLQLHRKESTGSMRALVSAFAARGRVVATWLPPGNYVVPTIPRASLEDQALFQDLYRTGLLRLNAAGSIEVAPRDLASWQIAAGDARADGLAGWTRVPDNPEALSLFKRLYRMADGAYVREQVRVFNNERRLLAWRMRPSALAGTWQASVAGAPAATSAELPLAASRLFAEVPQGWNPWSRISAWPDASATSPARISMPLAAAAKGDERIDIMLVGRLQSTGNAQLAAPPRHACTGRACPSPSAAQTIVLTPAAGARSIDLDVLPLDFGPGGGDQQYRHLRVADGKLAWRVLAANSATARRADPAPVVLHDRHGALLWSGGAPSPQAAAAGLAPMLGLRAEHGNSVAGMLARIPSPGGEPHNARLTLDLQLQQASQAILDCVGMRRGRWDGARCAGGESVPAGRQAGIVILDTGSGDVLAAAGAGSGHVDGGNWNEVRDFDRANPDRSPLRLPALQHDGGAHRSPGSTFKIVSALGLELAAQRDAQINALLAGMPLPAINRMAQAKGFAFQTNAASYPYGTRLAHITNYKDQHLDRRAQAGRLGLSQALTYSLNTWFAWSGELSDASLFGKADGGAPDLQALDSGALDSVRPIVAMAHRVGFERELRLDGGLLPQDFPWSPWDALQASRAQIDPIRSRHELRQMAIGLRMQATPLHMAMVAGAVGEGRAIVPRLLLELDGRAAADAAGIGLDVRLDRVRAGMKGVVDSGTAAGAFGAPELALIRRGLSGKTGTSPAMVTGTDGARRELATVWFTGWLEPGSLPGQKGRLAVAAFVSHSDASGGAHAAPVVAAVLREMAALNREQKGK